MDENSKKKDEIPLDGCYSTISIGRNRFPTKWPDVGDENLFADYPFWSATSGSLDDWKSPLMSAIIFAETGAFSSWTTQLALNGSQGFQRPVL